MGLPSLPRLGRRGQTNIGNSGAAATGAPARGGGCCVGGIMGGTGAMGAIEVMREVPPGPPLLPPPLTPLRLVPQLLLLLLLLLLPPPDPLETIDWAPTPEAPSAPAEDQWKIINHSYFTNNEQRSTSVGIDQYRDSHKYSISWIIMHRETNLTRDTFSTY